MGETEPDDLFVCRAAAHELISDAYAYSRELIKAAELWNDAPLHECAGLTGNDLSVWAIDNGLEPDSRLSNVAWNQAAALQVLADRLMGSHESFSIKFTAIEEEFAIGGQCIEFLNLTARSYCKGLSEFAWHLLTETFEAIESSTAPEEWDSALEKGKQHGIRPSAIPTILQKTAVLIDGIDIESSVHELIEAEFEAVWHARLDLADGQTHCPDPVSRNTLTKYRIVYEEPRPTLPMQKFAEAMAADPAREKIDIGREIANSPKGDDKQAKSLVSQFNTLLFKKRVRFEPIS